jgi:two-component system, NarL family, nitrate/nitrite response regulator NarL
MAARPPGDHGARMPSTRTASSRSSTASSTPPAPIRVVIADDHPLFRDGMRRAVTESAAFELAGEAADGDDALAAIEALDPDVVLLDVRMPGIDGITVLERLRQGADAVPVVLLSAFADGALIRRANAAGVSAYLRKDADREQILRALEVAAHRGLLVDTRDRRATPSPPVEGALGVRRALITRQRQILQLIAFGWDRDEIVMLANIPPSTYDAHVADAARTLGAAGVDDAIEAARDQGEID